MPPPNPNSQDLANKLTLTFKWENKKAFELKSDNDVEKVTIIRVEEDGNIALLWSNIEAVCSLYVKAELEKMGKDMKEA